MAESFASLASLVKRARDIYKGTPIANNTRARVVKGTRENPEVLAVRFHATDILRYYPDGSIDCIDTWTDSPTTNQRISEYAGIGRYRQVLPVRAGRLPMERHAICIRMYRLRGWTQPAGEHVVCNSSNKFDGYIRFRPDGEIELDSIKPITVNYVSDPKRLRQLLSRVNVLKKKFDFAQRLGMDFQQVVTNPEFRPGASIQTWMLHYLEAPPEEVSVGDVPRNGMTIKDGKLDVDRTFEEMSRLIVKKYDLLEEVEIKTFTR